MEVVTEATYLLVAALPASRGVAGFEKYFQRPAAGRSEFERPGPYLDDLWKEAQGLPVIEEHSISALGLVRPVYFVGPPGRLAFAAAVMPDWLNAGGPSKVPVWFAESFFDFERSVTEYHRPVAWWAMSCRFMFTLERARADQLKAAIYEEIATGASFARLRW